MDQNQDTVALAKKLIARLENARDFGDTKKAVWAFVTAMDTKVCVLGDSDLCQLAGEALTRRGKPLQFASLFAQLSVAGGRTTTMTTTEVLNAIAEDATTKMEKSEVG